MAAAIEELRRYFSSNGLLFCNRHPLLPSLETVGGDLNAVMTLIENGEVFYTHLYHGRVTYLSRDLYEGIRPCFGREEGLPTEALTLLNCLKTVGTLGYAELRQVLPLSNKAFSDAMSELYRRVLVTAIGRDPAAERTSLSYGTSALYALLHPYTGTPTEPVSLLGGFYTPKQFTSLLRRGR